MIRGVHDHNKSKPKLALHMPIGINAGEPIVEDNDLFGSTVQMAARICDAAETDHMLVSNIVRELCHGKSLGFKEAGK
jgi:class 3 adenylate cyclase